MTNWWEYEPKGQRLQRQAQAWKTEAQKRGVNYLAGHQATTRGKNPSTIETVPTAFDRPLLQPAESRQIVPEQKGSNFLDKIALNDIEQPWDLLRPIAKLFEAEQRYLSGPLARTLYENSLRPAANFLAPGDPLPEYERLPPLVRAATENLLSPTTWIAPTSLMKLAKVAPSIARGIPALGAITPSVTSKAGLRQVLEANVVRASIPGTAAAAVAAPFGGEAASQLGLPRILGEGAFSGLGYSYGANRFRIAPRMPDLQDGDQLRVVNPNDLRAYHGTYNYYRGLPRPGHATNFGISNKRLVYMSTDPEEASFYAGTSPWERDPKNIPENARIIPTVLKKDVKYWDPDIDPFPRFMARKADGTMIDSATIKGSWQTVKHGDMRGGYFLDFLGQQYGTEVLDNFIDTLQKAGYQAAKTAHEIAVWDVQAFRPLYDYNEVHKYIGGSGSAKSDYDTLRKELQRALKDPKRNLTEVEAEVGAARPDDWQPKSQDLTDMLQDSIEAVQLNRKLKSGNVSDGDILRAQELLARYEASGRSAKPKFTSSIMPPERGTEDWYEQQAISRSYDYQREGIALNDTLEGLTDVTAIAEARRQLGGLMSEGLTKYSNEDLWQLARSNQDHLDSLEDDIKNAADRSEQVDYRKDIMLAERQKERITTELQRRSLIPGESSSGAMEFRQEPAELTDIIYELENVPDPLMPARTVTGDVLPALEADRSLTQMARTWLDERGSPVAETVKGYINRMGIRLYDDDSSFLIREYKALKGLLNNQTAFAGDLITQSWDRVVKSGMLERFGLQDEPEQLFRNLFQYVNQVSPQEMNLLMETIEMNRRAWETARAFGVPVQPFNTPNGFNVSLQSATEQPLSQSIGGVVPVTRPDTFATRAEAAATGIPVREFVDAQVAYVSQLMKASADKWLEVVMKPYSKTLEQLLPQDLVRDAADIKLYRGHIKSLDQHLSDAIRAKRYLPVRNLPAPLQAINDLAVQGNSNRRQADRIQAFKDARQQLVPLLQQTRRQRNLVEPRLTRIRGEIQRRGGTLDFPVERNNRFYEESAGKQLNALDPRPSSDPIQAFNNFVRPLMATLDLSFLGVNGLVGLGSNPKAFMRAVVHAFSSEAYNVRVRQAADSGLMDRFIQAGGVWMSKRDLGEFLFTPAAQKLIPGSGTANALFSRFGNAMRLELFSSGEHLVNTLPPSMRQEALKSLARNASLATGYSPNPASRVENTMMFAPRFFRSQMGLIADALTVGTAGSANQMSRSLARKQLITMMVAGTGLTYAANLALGEDTVIDPRDPNFMRIRALGQDISVFGPWDTLVRAVSNSYKDGFHPEKGIEYLGRAKAGPAFSKLLDLIYGETFTNDPIDFSSTSKIIESMNSWVRASTPIAAQSVMQQAGAEYGLAGTLPVAGGLIPTNFNPAQSGVAGILGASVLETVGAKTTPISERERRDLLATDIYNTRWRDLEPYQRQDLQQRFPDIANVTARNADDVALEDRRAISVRFADRQQLLDNAFEPGPEWLEAYHNLKREQTGAFGQWEAEHSDLVRRLNERDRTLTPNEQAREDYFNIFRRAQEETWTPDQLTDAIDGMQSSWSTEQAAYMKRNSGLSDTPTVREYKADNAKLKGYYAIQDQVWDKIQNRPGFSDYSSLDEYVLSKADELRAQGMTEGLIRQRIQRLPVVRQFTSAVNELQRRYRRAHPEVDAVGVKWRGWTPIRQQQ